MLVRFKTNRVCVLLFAIVFLNGAAVLLHAQEKDDPAAKAIAFFNAGQDAHEKGDAVGAADSYRKALALLPEFPEAELQLGNAHLALKDEAAAEAAFRRALAARPDWTLAMASLGSLLVNGEKFAEAETLLTKAVELDAQNFPALAALADLRIRSKAPPEKLQALLTQLRALTNKVKTPASIWAARAAVESTLGDNATAKATAARAVALESDNVLALTVLIGAAIIDRDHAAASELVVRLAKVKPDARILPILRARVLLAQDKTAEALAILNSVPQPGADVLELRARINSARTLTVPELEKMLASDQKDTLALGRLCALLRTENPPKALEYCRRASNAEPDNVAHAVGYGAALVQAKRFADAVGLFRKIIALAPENNTARANLATALFQLKNYPEAKAEYRWLTDRQPDNPAAYFFLGLTHDLLGEYLDAMANYQHFLKIADKATNGLEIEKVNLRLPPLEKLVKQSKGKRANAKS